MCSGEWLSWLTSFKIRRSSLMAATGLRRADHPAARPGPAPARPRRAAIPGRPGPVGHRARPACRPPGRWGRSRPRPPASRSEGRRPAGHATRRRRLPGHARSRGLRRDDLRRDGHRLGIESIARDIAGDGPPVRLANRHDADGRGPSARRDAELIENDLGDDAAMTLPLLRGSSRPMVSDHRVIVIISNALGRTCGRQRHADAGGRRRLVVHPARGSSIALLISPSPIQQGSRRRLSGSLRCGRVRPTPARRRHAPC